MKVLKCIFAAVAGLVLSITVPAQQLPPLPRDPSIEAGTLGCGASYYIVKAPIRKGYATVALVQQGDSLTAQKREGLSSAFLARMEVGPAEGGFITQREGSTVYRFQDIPVYRKEVLDSMLLYTFSKMAESRAPQAIVVSGDVEPTAELLKKMEIFSMLVHKLPAPIEAREYRKTINLPVQLDFALSGKTSIKVAYSGPRIPDVFMNTAQAIVTDIFGLEFLVLLRNRLEKDLRAAGIAYTDISFDSLRSGDHLGDERYSVSVTVAPNKYDQALRVMARTIASFDAKGASVQEYTDAKEVIKPGLLQKATVMQDNVDRCIANFLFGANLAPASEIVRLFAKKNIPEETETRLFNKYASALLAGEDNLSLSITAADTLDPAQALMIYNANYNNAFAFPGEADYSWHRADTSGLEFHVPRVRIQKEKQDPVSGGVMWTFANGIRVVFKELRGSGMFSYSLVLNGGLSQIPDLAQGEGGHIGPMLSLYDVGGMPAPVFRDVLEVNGLSMKAQAWLNSLVISGSAPSGKFPFLLKALLAIQNESVLNTEEFARYSASQQLTEPSAQDIIYRELHPGFRYSTRPGTLTSGTQEKAHQYFQERFSRFNDGILIISGDVETGVAKKFLSRYLGGFAVQKNVLPRRAVEFKARSGAETIISDAGEPGIRVAMEAPLAVTSDNFYTSKVAADAMRLALIRELSSYGFTADVTVGPMTQPQERFNMEIVCRPVDGGDPQRAITAVRAAISKASKAAPQAADVSAWKAALMEKVQAAMASPQGFTASQQARYALNKDITSRYTESINSITPEKVRSFIATVASGGKVEYIVP